MEPQDDVDLRRRLLSEEMRRRSRLEDMRGLRRASLGHVLALQASASLIAEHYAAANDGLERQPQQQQQQQQRRRQQQQQQALAKALEQACGRADELDEELRQAAAERVRLEAAIAAEMERRRSMKWF